MFILLVNLILGLSLLLKDESAFICIKGVKSIIFYWFLISETDPVFPLVAPMLVRANGGSVTND